MRPSVVIQLHYNTSFLTSFQSDFVRGDSTTNELLHTYHTFCNAVDSGKVVRAVFCNTSKAFDRVWHRGLLHKLSGIGCSDKITVWAKIACYPYRVRNCNASLELRKTFKS